MLIIAFVIDNSHTFLLIYLSRREPLNYYLTEGRGNCLNIIRGGIESQLRHKISIILIWYLLVPDVILIASSIVTESILVQISY